VVFDARWPLGGGHGLSRGPDPFAQRTTGMRIIAALDDDDQALVMYEVTIGRLSR
jgi:hypothetical protein